MRAVRCRRGAAAPAPADLARPAEQVPDDPLRPRRHLEAQGLRFLAANVACRQGELDLVMQDGGTLVFVEVRYRASERFGGAAASVDARKQARLLAAAGYYLARHPTSLPCRFDVVAIGAGDQIRWIKHAFDGASS